MPGVSSTLTLNLPDETYQAIIAAAAASGKTPDDWLAANLGRLLPDACIPAGEPATEQEWDEGLLRQALYWQAGHAVASHLLGRTLVRIPFPQEDDEGSPAHFLGSAPPGEYLRGLATWLTHWLVEVTRLEEAGRLTAEDAEAARADLWRPFLVQGYGEGGEGPVRPEERCRKDLAALLAGGEAVRLICGGPSNPCLAEAWELARGLPPEAQHRALSWAYSRAEALVADHRPAVEALAAALRTDGDLDGPRAEQIIDGTNAGPPGADG
jgi:hypothetical protein